MTASTMLILAATCWVAVVALVLLLCRAAKLADEHIAAPVPPPRAELVLRSGSRFSRLAD